MKQWEDIVKERLEGYESTLPKGSLAEFQKLRAAGKATPRKKVYPLMWAAAVAVAASLVTVFFLRQPTQPEEGVQLVQQQPVEVQLMMADSVTVEEPVVVATPLVAQAVTVKPATKPVIAQSQPELEPQPEPQAESQPEAMDVPEIVEETLPEKSEPEEDKETPVTVREEPFIPTGSPFIPASRPRQKVNLKVALPVTGGVLGTSALALLASNMLRASHNEEEPASAYYSVQQVRFAYADLLKMNNEPQPPNPDTGTSEPVEKLLEYHFAFPLRIGLSTRIPVWNHLYLNTGFEYSRYTSDLSFLLAGAKTQVAQYLGIPLRMDWVFPMGKWFDAYAGAGLQADFCVGATWNGDAVPRDKINLSLGTAAGIQVNPRPHIGLFVEPQLSWRVPTTNDVLLTYRIQHPWMFSVSAGVRINLEKR